MAITGNTNPWAAGAVTFNTQPYAAFYERQMLRKQAKEDALENYFKDLGKNVTSAGMRVQDVPVLMQKQKDWQQFYLQNKAAILNPKLDNGDAYSRYMSGFQDQLALTSESKSEAKKDQELARLRFNPEAKHIFDDPNFIKDKELDNLPIGDPKRKRFDLLTAALPPKPIGVKELEAYNKYLTGKIQFDKIPGETENIGGFKTRTPIYTQFSPKSQRQIGANAAAAFDTDKTWRNEAVKFFDKISNDPIELDRYNQVFKSLYGNDIDSAREAWMAKGIVDNNMKATEFKEGTDEWGKMVAMQRIRQADAKELIKFKKQIDPNDTEMNNVWYETYLGDVVNKAKQSGQLRHIYTSDGKSVGYYNMIQPDQFLMKAFSRRGNEPDKLGVTTSGEIIPIFYKYDDKKNQVKDKAGNPVIDMDDSQPMSYNQALVNLGYRGATKKQLGQDMQQVQKGSSVAPAKQKSFTYNGKSYTRKQLNDMGYDDNEIEDYLKQGILK